MVEGFRYARPPVTAGAMKALGIWWKDSGTPRQRLAWAETNVERFDVRSTMVLTSAHPVDGGFGGLL